MNFGYFRIILLFLVVIAVPSQCMEVGEENNTISLEKEIVNVNTTENNSEINKIVNDVRKDLSSPLVQRILNGIRDFFNEIGKLILLLWREIEKSINKPIVNSQFTGNNSNDEVDANYNKLNRVLLDLVRFQNSSLLEDKDTNFALKTTSGHPSSNMKKKYLNNFQEEEELLSPIVLSLVYIGLFITCWIIAFIRDRVDWISIYKRPHTVYLQQIPNKIMYEKKVPLIERQMILPWIYVPSVNVTVGHIRIITMVIQTIFFPVSIVYLILSGFKYQYYNFGLLHNKLKELYDSLIDNNLYPNYYYIIGFITSSKDIENKKKLGKIMDNTTVQMYNNWLDQESLLLLNVVRELKYTDETENFPTSFQVHKWSDDFWFRLDSANVNRIVELLPRIASIILLTKIQSREPVSLDYLRRVKMYMIGIENQGIYVRDWLNKNIKQNNPKLCIPFNWIPRKPIGSINILLHNDGINVLIEEYRKRIGIYAEASIQLFFDTKSNKAANVECYLWFSDEMQSLCIHPTILCNCTKGIDALDWFGPFGFIPFETIISTPQIDTINGTITLMRKKKAIFFDRIDKNLSVSSQVFSTIQSEYLLPSIQFSMINNKDEILNVTTILNKFRYNSRTYCKPIGNLSISTESTCSFESVLTKVSYLPNSVMKSNTNDVFWGDKLNIKSNLGTQDYLFDNNSYFWDFDMPVPFTAVPVIINGVLTYLWLNYDSLLLCIQRKDKAIQEDCNQQDNSNSATDESIQCSTDNNTISLTQLKTFDNRFQIESCSSTPNSDFNFEVMEAENISKQKDPDSSLTNEKIINNVKVENLNNETQLLKGANIWKPFNPSLTKILSIYTSNKIVNLHPIYGVPGVLGSVICTRGYAIGSIVNTRILTDSIEEIPEEYKKFIEAQVLLTFEGGFVLKISTFTLGMANAIKSNLDEILKNMEDSVMNSTKYLTESTNEKEVLSNINNLASTLLSNGISPPDIALRSQKLFEFQSQSFKASLFKFFMEFHPVSGSLNWNSASPRIYRWLSYVTSSTIAHFFTFYMLSIMSRRHPIWNGIIVGYLAYFILNICKSILNKCMNFPCILQTMNIRQQAAHMHYRLWINWISFSTSILLFIILTILTILQSIKQENNTVTSNSILLNEMYFAIGTWIAVLVLSALSLILQPLFLALIHAILIYISQNYNYLDGIMVKMKYIRSSEVTKTGYFPVRPDGIIKIQNNIYNRY
ncbi:uncharacterized protein CMU_039130 [Cryptosporidium muris RN66]|uniref:Uncharacterized protein n=1 Tax=Cryptosporidium muris (strain RN66) TaxID=441375 RepID=B6A9F5_CRYMR|nr:uncharacterized protein CMU_039130 [Cryptosporidium muris RN66]EEA04846.1 hypothetical protein, conserved [Cryptosporidium muris RN66]|eukprot:XP_002139195.1 hypothetical protein [Cryptosporidium muris RN66]